MDKIEELLTRGVDTIYPIKEELEKVLRSGKKLKIYQGFDPTGTQLHIGHMVGLRKLRQWQDLGHHVIFLIGDFTAMVGDPSGKYSARKVLKHEETLKNAKGYKDQASKILNFSGNNPAKVLYNGTWLGKISTIEFLRISGYLTYSQVVERDMFQQRIKQGQDVYANEFLYPVMQAYDSVAMDVNVEIGGRDQMFNMLIGRKLMRNMLKKEKFVMTTTLLEDSKGIKIGKTEGNAIGLTDDPKELYAKIVAFPDEVIIKCFECLTQISMEDIKTIEKEIKDGQNPLRFKKQLAFEIVKDLNNQQKAKAAQEHFEKTVQLHQPSQDLPEYKITESEKVNITDFLVKTKLATSKSDAKRLVEQGGVSFDDVVIKDPSKLVEIKDQSILKVGKRRTLKIAIGENH